MGAMRSNWGRWGADDERGAANLLTPDHVLAALTTPLNGRVYELGIEVRRGAPTSAGRTSPQHFMLHDGGDFAALERNDWGTADDYIMLPTQGTTHLDGLAHMWYDGRLYNGHSYREVRSSGTGKLGVEKLGGLITTAHLVDATDRIRTGELELDGHYLDEVFARRGTTPRPGDALLLRSGWMEDALAGGVEDSHYPVLAPTVAEWIADHDLAVVGADNIAVEATGRRGTLPPLHKIVVRDLGVTLLEMLHLREPGIDGVERGLLVVAPLRISRGVGSPVNPLLIT